MKSAAWDIRNWLAMAIVIFAVNSIAMAVAPQLQSLPDSPNNVSWADLKQFLAPEIITPIIFMVSGLITGPITALLKDRLGTRGVDTERVNYFVSMMISGLIPYVLGLYGYSSAGFAYALATATVRALVDQGKYKLDSQKAAKGIKIAERVKEAQAPILDDVTQLQPADAAPTEYVTQERANDL